ncbi:MAG: hypothetical protein ABL961_11530 [Vicinamibacterales bacterium]
MRHLRPEQLLDVAEGAADASVVAHVDTCVRCRREVSELKTTLAAVCEVDVPEPSPLFWDHLSARVRDGVGVAAPGRGWGAYWFGWQWAGAVGLAVLLMAVATSWRADEPVSVTPVAAAVPVVEPLLTDDVPVVEDASLDLLADLASPLEWDAAVAAGLLMSAGAVDRVVLELTAFEREELGRLLTAEMAEKSL